MSFLKELTSKDKGSLKPTTIVVRHKDGSTHEERVTVSGVQVQSSHASAADKAATLESALQSMVRKLNVHSYDAEKSKWGVASSDKLADDEAKFQDVSKISIVSYNVWFDQSNKAARAQGLMDLLHSLDPKVDIFCFQEVTVPFLEIVKEQAWVRDEFYLSEIGDRSINPYGVIIGTRFPPSKFEMHEMPSRMGRKLVKMFAKIGEVDVQVGTVHLESLGEADTRIDQLRIIWKTFVDAKDALFMGDTNIYDGNRECKEFDPTFTDLWPALHPDTPALEGSTMAASRGIERIDRIFCKLESWKPDEIRIIGKNGIGDGDLSEVTPSDHLGLHGVFSKI
jgi:endonuclease/exonuclease/phosphatase family metal-dependent hydrolase